jgi:hypothetical protein
MEIYLLNGVLFVFSHEVNSWVWSLDLVDKGTGETISSGHVLSDEAMGDWVADVQPRPIFVAA